MPGSAMACLSDFEFGFAVARAGEDLAVRRFLGLRGGQDVGESGARVGDRRCGGGGGGLEVGHGRDAHGSASGSAASAAHSRCSAMTCSRAMIPATGSSGLAN